MATKRRRKHEQSRGTITAEAIRAFRDKDRIGLHRALGLRPWEWSPLDADSDETPPWRKSNDDWARDYAKARELRKALQAAK